MPDNSDDLNPLAHDSSSEDSPETKAAENRPNELGLAALKEMIGDNHKFLEKLENQFKEKIAYDNAKETAFNKLYEELKQYKENFLFLSQKPVYIDLILLFDNIEKMQENLLSDKQIPGEALNSIQSIKEELLEILYRRDVIPFDEKHDTYQFGRQKAVRVIATDNEKEHNQVIEVLRKGFLWSGNPLRTEEVIIKKFKSNKGVRE